MLHNQCTHPDECKGSCLPHKSIRRGRPPRNQCICIQNKVQRRRASWVGNSLSTKKPGTSTKGKKSAISDCVRIGRRSLDRVHRNARIVGVAREPVNEALWCLRTPKKLNASNLALERISSGEYDQKSVTVRIFPSRPSFERIFYVGVQALSHEGCNVTFPDQTSEQDAQTLQGCLKDIPGAWETFVGRFGRLFAWVVDRTARSRGIALSTMEQEESVAEILFELVRNDKVVLRSFAGRSSLATYLTVIARRVTVHRFMRRTPRQTEVTDMVDPQTQATILVEQRDHIESLMAFLNESEAKLVRLHHLEHRSYGEISRLTGLPLGSIGPALTEAREKMKRSSSQRAG